MHVWCALLCVHVCASAYTHACVCVCLRVGRVAEVEPTWGAAVWSDGREAWWTQGVQPQKRKLITKEFCLDSYGAGKEKHPMLRTLPS